MTLRPFVVDRFAGLDLANDPQEVGASSAVDLMNVSLDRRGRLRCRDGYTLYATPATATPPILGVGYGPQFVVAAGSGGGFVEALNSSGTSVAASGTNKATGLAKFGTPSASYVYAAGASVYSRWDGATWTDVASAPATFRLAVTPWDNRMVSVSGSTVRFSDAGDAETWPVNNNVGVTPGDSESLVGCVSWRDMIVMGKQTKLFVFYGTSTDADGLPIFNYRTIDAGVGPVAPAAQTVTMAAGKQGVYFIGQDGVYVTTGGVPVKISGPLDPWFRGDPMPTGSIPSFTGAYTKATIGAVGDNVYVSPEPGVSSLTFVYHVPTDSWTAYGWAMQGCVPSPYGAGKGAEAMISLTDNKLYRHSGNWTTDNGSAVSWSYTSGAYDPSGENRVAVTLESALWGIGSASLQVGVDHGAVDTGSSLTLGTSPTVADAFQQVDREGTYWQHRLSGSGPATVSRLVHYLAFVKPAGVE